MLGTKLSGIVLFPLHEFYESNGNIGLALLVSLTVLVTKELQCENCWKSIS